MVSAGHRSRVGTYQNLRCGRNAWKSSKLAVRRQRLLPIPPSHDPGRRILLASNSLARDLVAPEFGFRSLVRAPLGPVGRGLDLFLTHRLVISSSVLANSFGLRRRGGTVVSASSRARRQARRASSFSDNFWSSSVGGSGGSWAKSCCAVSSPGARCVQ